MWSLLHLNVQILYLWRILSYYYYIFIILYQLFQNLKMVYFKAKFSQFMSLNFQKLNFVDSSLILFETFISKELH